MKPTGSTTAYLLALSVAAMFAASPAIADKPAGAGAAKSGNAGKPVKAAKSATAPKEVARSANRDDDRRGDAARGERRDHFDDKHRSYVRDYYDGQFRSGRCPPGLAKKQNGCMPPGQAKKWRIGQPIPRDVIFYEVPRPLVLQLGQPPAGHRYVRVASDILLITAGSGMIIDAIQDLGRM